MATVNKDFRVKHGLVVEGTTATVNGSNVLTEGSTEFIQDTAASLLTSGSHSGISFTYDDNGNVINATVSSTPTFTTSITFEGAVADDYETVLQVSEPTADRTITLPNASGTVALTSDIPTDEYMQDLVGAMVSSNTETGVTVTYQDSDGTLDFEVDTEYIQDIVGAMVSSNSESGITVTYDDTNGKLDFSVPTLDTESVQDIVGGMVSSNSESGIAVTYDDTNGKLDFDVADFTITLGGDLSGSATVTNLANATLTATIAANSVALGTDTTGDYVASVSASDGISATGTGEGASVALTNTDKGSSQNIFKNVAVSGQSDIVADSNNDTLTFAGGTGITLTTNATTDTLTVTNAGVTSLAGTGNQITASASTGSVTLSFPSAVTFPGTVTLNADPTSALQAATKQYVDAATAGLNVHDAVRAATTANINLANALENGDSLDGVTLATGNRVLVKNQTTKSQNGIYIVQASGAAVRATDYDEVGEVDAGDFVFVQEGTANAKTGWVQTNVIATIGSDDIEFTQFSGAGTYSATNGVLLSGTVFSLDVNGLTGESAIVDADTLPFYDGSASTNRKITADQLRDYVLGGVSGDITIDASGVATIANNAVALGTDTTGNYIATIAGTANQISVSGSGSESAAVTLSLPQSIATTSTPEFAALTLTNAAALTMANSSLADNTFTTSGTSAQVVDSWSATTYTSAKYLVQMKLGDDVEVIEILVTVDGNNNVYLTEYADVYSNAVLGTTDAVYNGGNVELKVTPVTTATVVKVHRTLIEA